MVKSAVKGDEEYRGYSVTWPVTEGTGGWRKVRGPALQTSGAECSRWWNSRCKCPEVGKILHCWEMIRRAIWPSEQGGRPAGPRSFRAVGAPGRSLDFIASEVGAPGGL